jgi:hypothetical protein
MEDVQVQAIKTTIDQMINWMKAISDMTINQEERLKLLEKEHKIDNIERQIDEI